MGRTVFQLRGRAAAAIQSARGGTASVMPSHSFLLLGASASRIPDLVNLGRASLAFAAEGKTGKFAKRPARWSSRRQGVKDWWKINFADYKFCFQLAPSMRQASNTKKRVLRTTTAWPTINKPRKLWLGTSPSFATRAVGRPPRLINTRAISKGLHYKRV
jgi:hypothetical protein